MTNCILKNCGLRSIVVLLGLMGTALTMAAEPLPAALAGVWRITRILPTTNAACWGKKEAAPMLGTTLVYGSRAMRWKGGSVPVSDIFLRTVTAKEFASESASATFAQVGLRSASVVEVNFQHEDMDITGASTEVPGDSVLIAGPTRIVVSACGVYMEAVKARSRGKGKG